MDDDFEIDLTADALDGLLPIRWIGQPASPPANGNGNGTGKGNGTAHPQGRAHARPALVPKVVTLASFMAVPPAPRPMPVLTLRERDEWQRALDRDNLEPVTLRDVMASRGARFLAVVVAMVFMVLVAATVLLWQRIEADRRPEVVTSPTLSGEVPAVLRGMQSRLNSLETRLTGMLDPSETEVTTSPAALQSDLDAFEDCVRLFQQQLVSRQRTINLC